ncbi:hypothetical protein K7432_018469 [Basidiobolus ranarum]|uniref:Yeast cell wall synthesis Kre9/Knh1-like N-terminal domain-containing protein n=1 Tax=Basidiobolus ranarum TaxID=34480 RepID=A0ABR2WC50_9FUNG
MFSKTLSSIAALALLANAVSADYSIVEPVEGTEWAPGKTVTISWIEVPGTTTPAKIDLALMVGDPALLQVSQTIASGIDSSAGTYTWTVPEGVTPSTLYAVRAGSGDVVKYSHYFNVNADGASEPSVSVASLPSEAPESAQSSASSHTGDHSSASTSAASASASVSASGSATVSSSASGSASVTGTAKASTSGSSSISSASSKPTGSASSAVTSSTRSSSTVITAPTGKSAGNALTISGVVALIPAALVAYMRQ